MIRRYFLIGLAGILPLLLTIIIIIWGIKLFDEYISQYVVRYPLKFFLQTGWGAELLTRLDVKEELIPGGAGFRPEAFNEIFASQWITYASLPLTLVAIWVIGLALAKFGGRRVLALVEYALERFPGVRSLYPVAKKLVEFFVGEQSVSFQRVVLVEYPRKEMWAIGLVTGEGLRSLNQIDRGRGTEEYMSIFLPSSPTPMTGYVVFVPIREVLLVDLTVDEAMTLIISGGVITPQRQQVHYAPEHVERKGTRVIVAPHDERA